MGSSARLFLFCALCLVQFFTFSQRLDQDVQRAISFQLEGKHDSAILIFNHILKGLSHADSAEQIDVLHLLGTSYTNRAEYEAAQHVLEIGLSMLKFKDPVDSSLLATFYLAISRNLGSRNRYDESIEEAGKALTILTQLHQNEHFLIADCYNQLGFNFRLKGKYDTAMHLYRSALIIYEKKPGYELKIAQNNYDLGWVHAARGDLHLAIDAINESLRLRELLLDDTHPKVAESIHLLAWCYRELGYFMKAKELYARSLSINLSKLGTDHPNVATSYHALGNLAHRLGEYDQALAYHLQGNRIWIDKFGDEDRTLVRYYNFLATTSRMLGRLDDMLTYSKKAVRIGEQLEEDHPEIVQTYRVIAQYHFLIGDYDTQLEYLRKAHRSAIKSFGQNHYYVAIVNRELGDHALTNGEFNQALNYHNKALNLFIERFGTKHVDVSNQYLNIASTYREMEEPEKSLAYHQKALESVSTSFKADSRLANPSINQVTSQLMVLKILERKGQLLLDMGGYEIEALSTLKLAIALLDEIRLDYSTHESKQSAYKSGLKIYENALQAVYALYQDSEDEKYIEQGFEISESSKSFILLNAINESSIKNFANVPDSIRQTERRLKIETAYFKSKLVRAERSGDSLKMQTARAQLFEAEENYKGLQEQIRRDYTSFYDLKFQTKVPAFEQVRLGLLDQGTALLEFFEAEDVFYIVGISQKQSFFHRVEKDEALLDVVSNYRRAITDYQLLKENPYVADSLYLKTSHLMYNLLLKDPLSLFSPDIEKLVIVTDGELNHVNFEAVLVEEIKGRPDYRTLPYLLHRYKLNYSYSASVLLTELPGKKSSTVYGGFAPAFDEGVELDSTDHSMVALLVRDGRLPLPGAKEEIELVSKLFGGDTWVGGEATEETFKDRVSDYQIVHLATHGLLDDKNPNLSELLFTPREDSINDGFLNVNEIYSLDLNAELVVLSACNTGYGEVHRGEGSMSISRAFRYAGCPSIVMSLWKIPDEPTKELMVSMYTDLRNRETKRGALHNSKRSYIDAVQDPAMAHPYYWAGFVLMGESDAIEIKSPGKWMYLLVSAAVLLGLLGARRYSRRSTNS